LRSALPPAASRQAERPGLKRLSHKERIGGLSAVGFFDSIGQQRNKPSKYDQPVAILGVVSDPSMFTDHFIVGAISTWRQVLAGAQLVKWPPILQCRCRKAGHLLDVGEEGSHDQEEGTVGR
jgi:hypothetical protein